MNVSFSETNRTMPVAFSESGKSVNTDFGNVQTVNIGLSAYQVAVKNGFKGTEQEWLNSLKGKDGYTPRKGIDYFDGQPGKDGKDGANGKDGYTPIKGKDYFDGKDGVDGKDGHTPEKGVDYFTAADKAEMVSAVISALPKYDGEVVAV